LILQFREHLSQVKNEELTKAKEGTLFDIDFGGEFLIQLQKKNHTLVATGKGINGYGEPIAFEPFDVVVITVLDD
jgi:hypothetical protein